MNQLFTFTDVIKKGFLELDAFQAMSPLRIVIALSITLLIGLFIYFVYGISYRGVVYNRSFSAVLVLMSLITSMIIMTVSANVVLSLGMVGALSIVRFRAAIKDPMDIVFLFWAISVGIASGAQLYAIASIGSLFVGITVVLLSKMKHKRLTYLLIVNYDDIAGDRVKMIIEKLEYTLKAKTVTNGTTELTLELKVRGYNTAFVNILALTQGVNNAVLVDYNGD